jgi:hypothetical protein
LQVVVGAPVAAHSQTPSGQAHENAVCAVVRGVAEPEGQSCGQSSIVAEQAAPVAHGKPLGSAADGSTAASPKGAASDSFAHAGPSGEADAQAA